MIWDAIIKMSCTGTIKSNLQKEATYTASASPLCRAHINTPLKSLCHNFLLKFWMEDRKVLISTTAVFGFLFLFAKYVHLNGNFHEKSCKLTKGLGRACLT
jgi:hypothetical protein